MNAELMRRYIYIRDHILQSGFQPEHRLETSRHVENLQAADPSWARRSGCNEWLLFHGTSRRNAEAICRENFSLDKVGCGAAGGVMGNSSKRALYGHGYYFAERITKGDEYSSAEHGSNHFTMLVCRVAGGKAFVCQEDDMKDPEVDKEVTLGPHHSIIGDRETRLGKPYKEVVVYSMNQVYPEYVLTYSRQM